MEEAKCGRGDPDLWDPKTLPRTPPLQRRRAAIERCSGCPVKAQCADFAVRTGASHLIYAGIPLGLDGRNQHAYAELRRLAKRLKGMQ
ncbi:MULTISPECIES: WhiB family transcriptional regulator [Nocardia]|uniref:WhiB family transcriptional regulator n=1 Tax=Nocardia TaxID=1817 RepID=UPI0009EF2F69